MIILQAFPGIILLAGIIYFFWKFFAKGTCWNKVFWPALLFKLSCGVLLGLFYDNRFDTFNYQAASEALTRFGHADTGSYLKIIFLNANELIPALVMKFGFKTYSNSFFFVKLLSLLNFITASQYYLNSLFLSFFSFSGFWFLIRKLDNYFPGTANAAIIGFLVFPSVVFWNAGVLKESLLAGLLGYFWGSALQIAYSGKTKKWWQPGILLLLAGYGLWQIKFFVAAFVFGLTGIWLGLRWLRFRFALFRKPLTLLVGLIGLTAIFGLGISLLHENFTLQFLLDRLVWNYEQLYRLSAGRPRIELSGFEPEIGSILKNIPEAFFGVLYRPFVWEGDSWLYCLAGLENLILAGLTLGVLAGLPTILKRKPIGFYLMLLVFCLVLAATFALATPNLGSLNRYRATFLPFLIYLALQAPVWQRLLRRLEHLF